MPVRRGCLTLSFLFVHGRQSLDARPYLTMSVEKQAIRQKKLREHRGVTGSKMRRSRVDMTQGL